MESETIPPSLELLSWKQPQSPITPAPPDNRSELILGNLRDNVIANLLGIGLTKHSIPVELRTHVESQLRQLFPSFHTPDHPTYASMIRRAIEEINEKSGASGAEISTFLKKEYKDLPFAHESFLCHHLKKLCDNKDIVQAPNGRYMFPEKVGNSEKVLKRYRKRRQCGWQRSKHCGMIAEERSKESSQPKMTEKIERLVLQGRERIHGQETEFAENLDKLDGWRSNKFKEQNVVDKQLISTTEQHIEEFMTSTMTNRSEEFLSEYSPRLLLTGKPHGDCIELVCGLRTNKCLEKEHWKQKNRPGLENRIEQGKQPQYDIKEQSRAEELRTIVGSRTSVSSYGESNDCGNLMVVCKEGALPPSKTKLESSRQGEHQNVLSTDGKRIIVCGLLSQKQYQTNVSGKKMATKLQQYETLSALELHAELGYHEISTIQQSHKRKAEINTNIMIPFPSNPCYPTKRQRCKRRGRPRKLKPDAVVIAEGEEIVLCSNRMMDSSLCLDLNQQNYNEQQQNYSEQQQKIREAGRLPDAVKAVPITQDASLHSQQQQKVLQRSERSPTRNSDANSITKHVFRRSERLR